MAPAAAPAEVCDAADPVADAGGVWGRKPQGEVSGENTQKETSMVKHKGKQHLKHSIKQG